MATKGRRVELFEEVEKQIRRRVEGPPGDLKAAQQILAYLSWMAWHCRRYAAMPTFLDAARSDIVAILYAGAIGMERSAYLHARSLLENLVRHCYFDSRPALFAARHLIQEDSVQDKWSELFKEIQALPHFWPTRGTGGASQGEDAVIGGSILFAELKKVYVESSRFVHGSTASYRSAYDGIFAITLDGERTERLGTYLQTLGEVSLLLLAMYHIGPYLLISQPIRRYMLGEMRQAARWKFLECMQRVSMPWAQHQRSAALRVGHERGLFQEDGRRAVPTADGLLLDEDGRALVVKPEG